MPEVLPAPTESGSEGPRERTRAHLRKLLGAVAGVALGATTAHADTTVPGPGKDKGNDKKPPPSESKPKPPPRESLGYEVVDMLPEPAPEPTTGFLSITSTPSGAEVSLDGVALGVSTPLVKRKVSTGRHIVTLKFSDGSTANLSVEVKKGETAVLKHSAAPKSPPRPPS